VHLLKSGVDLPTIAHWLGHASVNTTNRYVTVDLELKRKALGPLSNVESLPPSALVATWRSTSMRAHHESRISGSGASQMRSSRSKE
jgi:hypothetical protein